MILSQIFRILSSCVIINVISFLFLFFIHSNKLFTLFVSNADVGSSIIVKIDSLQSPLTKANFF